MTIEQKAQDLATKVGKDLDALWSDFEAFVLTPKAAKEASPEALPQDGSPAPPEGETASVDQAPEQGRPSSEDAQS